MAKKKQKRKLKKKFKGSKNWQVKETDKDLKNLDNLYAESCERCGRKGAGTPIKKMCAECIVSHNHCHFKLKKGLE